jgi:integrase/recombinase XerD
MFKYQKDGISVISVLDTRRKLDSNLYRVRIRVIFKRQVKEYNTGKELSADDWIELPKSKKADMRSIRDDIQSSFDNIVNSVKELSDGFSFDALNIRLGIGSTNTFNAIFQTRIDALKKEDRIGTAVNYSYALKAVESFAGKNIQISSITVSWLKRFENFLRDKGKSYTTIGIYARAIRSITGILKNAGIIKESAYPFGQGRYEIPQGSGRKIALSLSHVGQIVNYSDNFGKTPLYRDLWVFSYLCNGINIADLLQLKFSNISDGEIYWLRKKTERTSKKKQEIRAILLPEMQTIINKHGNPPDSVNYIFPFLKGGESEERKREIVMDITKRINRKMKIIAKKLGIPKVSTYTARHSFSTILKYSGASTEYIKEQLGHSSIDVTENYLKSFEKIERTKNASFLTKF